MLVPIMLNGQQVIDLQGRKAEGCPHLAEWWPVWTRFCIWRGYIKESVDGWQFAGDAAASGGVHRGGTCVDWAQLNLDMVHDAREAGAPGTWPRGPHTKAYGAPQGAQDMMNHVHAHLSCPCSTTADYQTTAVRNRLDGLSIENADYIKAPSTWRGYREGIAWMKQQMPSTLKPAGGLTSTVLTTQEPTVDYDTFATYMDRYGRELQSGTRGLPVLHSWAAIAWQAGFTSKVQHPKTAGDWNNPLDIIRTMIGGKK